MKTVIYSRDGRDYSRSVTEFIEMFGRKYPGQSIEIKDPDTRESSSLLSMLGVDRYPAIIVTRDNEAVVQMWQGEPLPLLDEVAAYALG
jgi:hypothetical protein